MTIVKLSLRKNNIVKFVLQHVYKSCAFCDDVVKKNLQIIFKKNLKILWKYVVCMLLQKQFFFLQCS